MDIDIDITSSIFSSLFLLSDQIKMHTYYIMYTYPNPVGRTLLWSKALMALDFPLLVRPKNTTFISLREITFRIIATFDRWLAIL